MATVRNILIGLAAGIAVGLPVPGAAGPVRDLSVPMRAVSGYEKARLVGRWYEVARSPSRLERDCHAVTADVETREDSRLTLKIDCRKGSVDGPVMEIDGILVELDSGVFGWRLVRLTQFGDFTLAVLWQSEDDGLAVIGTPGGELGWVWSKSAEVDAAALSLARGKLVAAGYAETEIRDVQQAP